MAKKYEPNKVPMENKLDAHYPGKAHNEQYLNTKDSGSLGDGVMGHASKVMHVDPAPNYDINRVRYSPYNNCNTPSEAFNYDY